MRKRDPRYKAHLAQHATASEQKRHASGTSTPQAGSSSTPSKKAQELREAYVEQEWQRIDTRGQHADLEWAAAEGSDPEEWECVVCGKSFRSEAAWDSHERSRKHIKEVERLQREMELENEELDLQQDDIELEDMQEDEIDNAMGQEEIPVVNSSPLNESVASVAPLNGEVSDYLTCHNRFLIIWAGQR